MSHAVLQAAQIMPINTQIPNNKSFFTKPTILHMINSYPIAPKSRKSLYIRDSLSPPPAVDGDSSIVHLERCLVADSSNSSSASPSAMLSPNMKGQYGAFGAVTLEKSKLDMTQKQTQSSPEVYHHPFSFM